MRGDKETEARFEEHLATVGALLRTRRQREHFATYAAGIQGNSPRKSCEPIAALGAASPEEAKRRHDNLLCFLAKTVWDDRAVRICAARQAIAALEKRGAVSVWVVADTGFPKQGKRLCRCATSVQRHAGKDGQLPDRRELERRHRARAGPVDFELYLPESGAFDEERRNAAHIPGDVGFATKTEPAIEMIDRAVLAGLSGSVVLAESAHGSAALFREYVSSIGRTSRSRCRATKRYACLTIAAVETATVVSRMRPASSRGARHSAASRTGSVARARCRRAFAFAA
jgi:SRSO17 transposase